MFEKMEQILGKLRIHQIVYHTLLFIGVSFFHFLFWFSFKVQQSSILPTLALSSNNEITMFLTVSIERPVEDRMYIRLSR